MHIMRHEQNKRNGHLQFWLFLTFVFVFFVVCYDLILFLFVNNWSRTKEEGGMFITFCFVFCTCSKTDCDCTPIFTLLLRKRKTDENETQTRHT